MRPHFLFSLLLTYILLLIPSVLSSSASDQSATIYYWPLSSPSPLPLALISYNPADLTKKSQVSSYTPPPPSSKSSSDTLTRIGLYDPSAKSWRGIVTKASVFSAELILLSLHLDGQGKVYHVSASILPTSSTTPKGGKEGSEDRVLVELVKAKNGPEPKLNKPVVLDADGRIPEKEPEKTFFQK
jgi:hypothetical protein